jgi:putative addiction module killer protein
MKKWNLEYWSDVEEWLDELTKEQLKSVAKELVMLAHAGNELRMPHSQALGSGLFELRERRYGYRIYYGFQASAIIILLNAGDKKSQKNDIKIARERLSKI